MRQRLVDKGNAADDFQQRRLFTDSQGMVHLHVLHTQGGVPVWGSEAILHLDREGNVVTVTDDFLPQANSRHLSLAPTLTSADAIARALEAAGFSPADLTSPATADLWIYRAQDGDHLAWRVQLPRTDGTKETAFPVIFVDAHGGDTLWSYDNLQTGIGNSMYSGPVPLDTTLSGGAYLLKDGARGNQQTSDLAGAISGSGTLFTDADDTWGDGTAASAQTAGVDAQYGAQSTWDYYRNVHGRNGIRNDGVGALSRVHYGNAYVNAYWSDSCFCMTYGDGYSNTHPLTSLDVAGHEMSHGVTSATAALVYSGESGGLNEANSDIFGTAVEFYANNPSDVGDYLIGEKIDIFGNGQPLRYMDRPSRDGVSADCWYSGVGNMDVHYSSGVGNHFFYLLSEGSGPRTINGVAYDSPTCDGSTVTGITRAKAEKIWYRALTTYMTSTTNYAAARTATLNAAADLYGAGSAEQAAVAAAWSAVNVGPSAPPPPPTALQNGVPVSDLSAALGSQLNFTLSVPSGASNLSFTISGGTGDADLYVKFGSAPTLSSWDCRPYMNGSSESCTVAAPQAGTYYVMLVAYASFSGVTLVGQYSTASPPPSALVNGGFEGGLAPWALSGTGAYYSISGDAPHSGTGNLYLGVNKNTNGAVTQSFTVPSTGNTLKLWLAVTSSETTTTVQYDRLFVEVLNSSGTVLSTLATYSNLNKTSSVVYVQRGGFSLAAWAGQTVRLRFRVTTDASRSTIFRIDDVTLN